MCLVCRFEARENDEVIRYDVLCNFGRKRDRAIRIGREETLSSAAPGKEMNCRKVLDYTLGKDDARFEEK